MMLAKIKVTVLFTYSTYWTYLWAEAHKFGIMSLKTCIIHITGFKLTVLY